MILPCAPAVETAHAPLYAAAQEGKAGGRISARASRRPGRVAGKPECAARRLPLEAAPPHRPVSPTAPVPNTAAEDCRLFPGSLLPKASFAFSAP